MNYKKIYLILVLFAIISTFFGGTLAYMQWKTGDGQSTNVVFTIDSDFTCSADGGSNITSNDVTLVPTSCINSTYAIKREINTYSSIDEDSNVPYIYMDLWLNINDMGQGLSNSQNFRYALTTSENSCTDGLIASGNFSGKVSGDKVNLLEQVRYANEEIGTYYLYIWLDAAETSTTTMNQTFNLSLGGTCSDMNINGYTISYDMNGGEGSIGDQHKNHNETLTLSDTVPTRAGYVFLGWSTDMNATTAEYQAGENFSLNFDMKLYAVWRSNVITVSFDPNGGSYAVDFTSQSYTSQGSYEFTVPVNGTYKLEVWGAQGGDGKSGGMRGGYGGYSVGNVLLTANTKVYVVVGGRGTTDTSMTDNSDVAGGYNGGGIGWSTTAKYGSGGGGATHIALTSGLLSTLSSKRDQILIVAGGGGGGFNHKNSEHDIEGGSGGGYQGGGNNPGTQTSLYFGQAFPTSYAGSGGGGGYYGGKQGEDDISAGGGSGYIGNSLLTDKAMYCYGCGTSSSANTRTYSVNTYSSTPTAQRAKSGSGAAKITLVEANISGDNKQVIYGGVYGELPTPIRNGYTFLGWYTQVDGGELVTEETIVNLPNEHTLYARWSDSNSYTISYDANGGSGAPVSQTKTHNVTLTLSSTVPTRDGYTFLGWSTSSTATSATYAAGGSYTANAAATLYAVWKSNRVYLYNNGNEYTSLTGGWQVVNTNNSLTVKKSISSGIMEFKATDSSTWRMGYLYTVNKIDITNYKKIYFNITYDSYTNSDASHRCIVFPYTSNDPNTPYFYAETHITQNTAGLYSVNISSLQGSYYVGLWIMSRGYDETHIIRTNSIYME